MQTEHGESMAQPQQGHHQSPKWKHTASPAHQEGLGGFLQMSSGWSRCRPYVQPREDTDTGSSQEMPEAGVGVLPTQASWRPPGASRGRRSLPKPGKGSLRLLGLGLRASRPRGSEFLFFYSPSLCSFVPAAPGSELTCHLRSRMETAAPLSSWGPPCG